MNAAFDSGPWIIAVKAAAAAMTDETGLFALVALCDRLRPWLGIDADEGAVCREQDLSLVWTQEVIAEDGGLSIGTGIDGRQGEPSEMTA